MNISGSLRTWTIKCYAAFYWFYGRPRMRGWGVSCRSLSSPGRDGGRVALFPHLHRTPPQDWTAPCFAGINTVRRVAPTGISPLEAREFLTQGSRAFIASASPAA